MSEQVVVAYKGFNKDMKCRDFQYEVGGEYKHDGDVTACKKGFHACEYPLDVFNYYPPAGSRFAVVEQSGTLSRDGGDTKVASQVISIKAELSLPGLIKAAIEYTFSRSKPEGVHATGDQGAASATGYEGRAMGAEGNAIFLVERDDNYNILAAWAGIVGKKRIKPGVWYTLKNGKPVEVK